MLKCGREFAITDLQLIRKKEGLKVPNEVPGATPIRTAQTVLLEFQLINFSLILDFQTFKIAIY